MLSAHFSWVCKQLIQLDGLLGQNFPGSRVAADMRQTLQAYAYASRRMVYASAPLTR
jgi:hypothetical protein